MGEQYLRGVERMRAKAGFVDLHQTHLTHRRGRLQLVHGVRPAAPVQALHALGDSATGDQHHFMSLRPQRGNLSRPVGDGLAIQATPTVSDQRAAHLDHQSQRFRRVHVGRSIIAHARLRRPR